ncbi:hypothetical protein B0H16DRAFT_1701977 [Mycena metata]|uniref:Uncharacterized protein n=1 Tax=Mycena metata TaxID=1033252 RepID=A0AAD7MF72_9AGAR|nr:hypothetical protein B0H16DRAFT_1701977 [Mycena metata]
MALHEVDFKTGYVSLVGRADASGSSHSMPACYPGRLNATVLTPIFFRTVRSKPSTHSTASRRFRVLFLKLGMCSRSFASITHLWADGMYIGM